MNNADSFKAGIVDLNRAFGALANSDGISGAEGSSNTSFCIGASLPWVGVLELTPAVVEYHPRLTGALAVDTLRPACTVGRLGAGNAARWYDSADFSVAVAFVAAKRHAGRALADVIGADGHSAANRCFVDARGERWCDDHHDALSVDDRSARLTCANGIDAERSSATGVHLVSAAPAARHHRR